MTIKITFAQRQLLDKLIAAGKKGVPVNGSSPTALSLVRGGYAKWSDQATSILEVTNSGMRFYMKSPERAPTSSDTESAATSPGASSTIGADSSLQPNLTTN
jgi:hypothetical protein